jgi:hypothetical protein
LCYDMAKKLMKTKYLTMWLIFIVNGHCKKKNA